MRGFILLSTQRCPECCAFRAFTVHQRMSYLSDRSSNANSHNGWVSHADSYSRGAVGWDESRSASPTMRCLWDTKWNTVQCQRFAEDTASVVCLKVLHVDGPSADWVLVN